MPASEGEKLDSFESILICTAVWKAVRLNSAIRSRTRISEPLMTLPVGASFTASAICSRTRRHCSCIRSANSRRSIVNSRSMADLLKKHRPGLQAGRSSYYANFPLPRKSGHAQLHRRFQISAELFADLSDHADAWMVKLITWTEKS